MKLKLFIEKFICKNTLIRLWYKTEDGHVMITDESDKDKLHKSVCMEWELLSGAVWQSKYANHYVVGVTDILVDSFYKEAVNIVIEKPLPCLKNGCMFYDDDTDKCIKTKCWLDKTEGEY